MANVVEITIKTRDQATSALKGIAQKYEAAGSASGKGFTSNFDKTMGTGLLGGLFGGKGGSALMDAQRQGQQVGLGFGRGMLQRFQQTLGTGLLSGLFGMSAGNKLFASAGNTVVQDAQRQGVSIAQGFAKGLSGGFASVRGQLSDIMGGLFGGSGGGADEAAGEQSGRDFGGGFARGIRDAFSKISLPSLGGGGGKTAANVAGGTAGGALPGIMGISAKHASILGLGGALLGGLPAVGAIGGVLGLAGVGGGLLKSAFSNISSQNNLSALSSQLQAAQLAQSKAVTPAQQKAAAQQMAGVTAGINALPSSVKAIFNAEQSIQNTWQNITSSLAPTFAKALSAVASLLKGLAPLLTGVFAAAGTMIQPVVGALGGLAKAVLPSLAQGFRAVGPMLGVLVSGLGKLLSGLLPGLVTLVKAASPAIDALASVFGSLGKDLGSMFTAFAPVMKQSAAIFSALAGVVSALFPIIGKLAAEMATALAPAFSSIAGIVKALEPVLVIIGKVIAQFAAAVLTDLVGVLGSVAQLVKDISPALTVLAKAFGQVFAVLENSGFFAILANAIESLVPIIAKLINELVKDLAPVFPILIQAAAQLASILAQLLAAGLAAVLQALIPIVGWVAKVVAAIIEWLAKSHLLIPLMAAIVIAMDPVGAAIGGLIIVIGLLATHWHQVWGDIKNWAKDAWDFLTHGWGQYLVPGLTLIRVTVRVVRDHWKAAWDTIKQITMDAWHWLYNNVFAVLINFFTKTIPTVFDIFKETVRLTWDSIKLTFLLGVNAIIGVMAKLPGPLGAPFRAAHRSISAEIAGIERDVRNTVGNIQRDWNSLHGKTLTLEAIASGHGGVKVASPGLAAKEIMLSKMAAGGMISGGTPGKDSVLGMLMPGEVVVPASLVKAGVVDHLRGILPGFAGGGFVSRGFGVFGSPSARFQNAVAGAIGSDGASLLQAAVNAAIASLKSEVVAGPASGGGFTQWAPGAGVNQWRLDVLKALSMLGLPSYLVLDVLYQMLTESGGNPNIVNKWDSNWLAGHPSVGLMQVIRGTFDTYAGPFRNTGPFEYGVSVNPLANIYAALNYGKHNGRGFGTGPGQIGSGHGYASGGATSSGWAVLGERGRELVRLPGGATVYPAGASGSMLAAGGGGVLHLQLDVTGGDQELVTLLRKIVRVKGGGDVQKALGRR